jgi:lysozyme family protein
MTRDDNALMLIGRVITREGGVKDVGDGKGITRYGQTDGWLHQYGLAPPKDAAAAAANYRTWLDRSGLIAICDQADSLAYAVIDFAVHSGASVSIEALQEALHVRADGLWGPITEHALRLMPRPALARRVVAERARFWGRLITEKPDRYAQYAHGWLNRLADEIEALD